MKRHVRREKRVRSRRSSISTSNQEKSRREKELQSKFLLDRLGPLAVPLRTGRRRP